MQIKPKESTKFDIVSLGEVMLRLDPGEDRIRTARSFRWAEALPQLTQALAVNIAIHKYFFISCLFNYVACFRKTPQMYTFNI